MFLLDTNVVSELRPGKPRQDERVRSWASRHGADQFYLSAVTVLELEIGVLRMERKDAAQGRTLRAWVNQLVQQFSARTLPFTARTALRCAALQVPDLRSFRDSMIAATAQEHSLTLMTRNVSDFAGLKLLVVNPWDT